MMNSTSKLQVKTINSIALSVKKRKVSIFIQKKIFWFLMKMKGFKETVTQEIHTNNPKDIKEKIDKR